MGKFTNDEMVRLVELKRITDEERIKIIEEVE